MAGGERLRRRAASASSSIASSRTCPLQATQGLGVRPSRWACSQPSTTPARNSSRRSIEKCGMPELVGERPGSPDGLGRAAAELTVALGVRPQLERHRDRLLAGVAHQQRRHGAVDASAHRHQRASRDAAPAAGTRAGRGPERPVHRVGGQLGGVELRRRAGPRAPRRSPRAPTLAASSRFVPRSRPTVALPAAIVAPQPLASKPASSIGRGSPPSLSASEMRTRSPQAAPPAAPVKRPAGVWPRPRGRSRWVTSCSLCGRTRASLGLSRRGLPDRLFDREGRPAAPSASRCGAGR